MRLTKKFVSIIFVILFSFFSCKQRNSTSTKMLTALEYADTNANELKKVIDYYSKHDEDSLKLKSAIFLIENMIGKGSLQYMQMNKNGYSSYPLFKSNIGIDSINTLKHNYEDSTSCGKIYYGKPIFIEDLKIISANLLIENIEYAFKAWELPWAKRMTFPKFKEFLLPYRIGNEPLQNWRKSFFENSKWIFNVFKNTTDPIAITSFINDSLKHNYIFLHKELSYFPGQLTVKELNSAKGGRCADLNMIMSYWLRAVGIPTVAEFTSYWANSNYGGHSWLAVLDTNNKFIPFNPAYDNPVRDSLPFQGAHLAKAYRNLFELGETYYKLKKAIYIENPSSNFIDVTNEYLPVSDVKIYSDYIEKEYETTIGVLNGVYWKSLETKTLKGKNSIVFKNIARNVLYAPIYKKERTIYGVPFFLDSKGKIQLLNPDTTKMTNISIDISRMLKILHKRKALVVYWNNNDQDWKATKSVNFLNDDPKLLIKNKAYKTIEFGNVPSNAIYKIIDKDTKPLDFFKGRPFIYNNELKKVIDY